MSSVIEDPGIPLIGMQDKKRKKKPLQRPPPAYLSNCHTAHQNSRGSTTDLDQYARLFATVGSRLARRKELYLKRRRLCDASLALAVAGIALMILETELVAHKVISRQEAASVMLKLCVTVTTVTCLVVLAFYHVLDVQLFTINNSMDDWRLALTPRRLASTLLELLVVAVHPIPGDFHIRWQTMDMDGWPPAQPVTLPLDVVLSVPMFLRLYLVLRCVMLHSRLYQDASSQSLGALNRINFNFRFIFKSMMSLYPDYALTTLMVVYLLLASWTLRLCEMYNDADHARVHGSFLNAMWMVAVTFLTIGYGDIVPNTMCGRGVAVISGMMGAGCTALVVAVLARKLELSSAEKYVHDFVLEIDMDKRLKHQAANIVKHGWRLYKLNKAAQAARLERRPSFSRHQDRQVRSQQSHLLRAIYAIREIKTAQRHLSDNGLTLLDVFKAQQEAGATLTVVRARQLALEGKVSHLEGKLNLIYEKLCFLAPSVPVPAGHARQ